MDDLTRGYRLSQFERLPKDKSEYPASIKIAKDGNSTNYLDITENELQKIKHILTSI